MTATPPLTDIAGRSVLFAMAADPEYGPHLRQRFRPVMTGVGPVEAGVVVASGLAHLAARDRMPDLVVSLGSAGSAVLEQTRVYQAVSVTYRDMDATPLGFPRGVTPFLDLPATVALPLRVPGVATASLSTGADIVSGDAHTAIAEDMVDMETWAVMRACHHAKVPLVALRGISDGADDLHHVEDWTAYLQDVDRNLADAVDLLAAALADGVLT
jgi:adenosylhomocysteine nucleosidase